MTPRQWSTGYMTPIRTRRRRGVGAVLGMSAIVVATAVVVALYAAQQGIEAAIDDVDNRVASVENDNHAEEVDAIRDDLDSGLEQIDTLNTAVQDLFDGQKSSLELMEKGAEMEDERHDTIDKRLDNLTTWTTDQSKLIQVHGEQLIALCFWTNATVPGDPVCPRADL